MVLNPKLNRLLVALCLMLAATTSSAQPSASALSEKLPTLGAQTTIMPLSVEKNIGRAWLAAFRNRAPISQDPLIADYLEYLTYHLKSYAEMDDYQLEIIAVDSTALNAFAVPGGVLGINTGILLQAEREDQLASIIAHELAHISQRHFARGQSQSNVPALAGMLAGIIAIAAGAPDAGIAAITATQAASLENQLRYSRQYEREADRKGIELLADSGFDPTASPEMFKIMLNNARLNRSNAYSFLSTHPITEARIADTRNRAANLTPSKVSKPTSDYDYIRTLIKANAFKNSRKAVEYFEDQPQSEANQFGLAQAYLNDDKPRQASKVLKSLLKTQANRIAVNVLAARAYIAQGKLDDAQRLMAEQYVYYPRSYPVLLTYAQTLEKQRNFKASQALLERLSYQRPTDPVVWEALAETAGLAGDIMQVHFARAEYFRYMGHYRAAERQLLYVLEDSSANNAEVARAEQMMADINDWQQQLRF